MVSVEVGFSLKLLRAGSIANHGSTHMWVLALWVVSFHVRFPVVRSLEKLAADFAFVGCFFWSRPLALLLDAVEARENWLHIESWKSSDCGMELGDVALSVVLGPLCVLAPVNVVCLGRKRSSALWIRNGSL